jgi:hypothetical protein
MRRPLLATIVAAALLTATAARWPGAAAAGPGRVGADPVVATAGDIACNSSVPESGECHQLATSDLLVNATLDAVFTLGDNQYPTGLLADFQAYYGPTWGRELAITHPSAGNHEYDSPDATGYYAYFGAAAGDPTKGYYSLDIGTWHVIVLNSNCSMIDFGPAVDGCAKQSPQEVWLRNDLRTHHTTCSLALWHHPRFSSGPNGNTLAVSAFWQDLYRGRVDVALNGHDHLFERFAPQDPRAHADPLHGIRQFIVGTGGKSHDPIRTPQPNSEVRDNTSFGVLQLTLHPTSFDWVFLPEAGSSFTDSGSGTCH